MSDGVAERTGSVELLQWHVEQLRMVADQLGDPCDTLLDAGEAAACVHAITTTSARALRALAAWHSSHAAELFDHEGDAEQDVAVDVRASAAGLRAFAGELEGVAGSHEDLIDDLRRWTHRAVCEVEADEVDDLDEYYAVVVVERASPNVELIERRYTREDVARSYARQLAQTGPPTHVYRVVPVLEGERLEHVAQWAGEGYFGDS